MNYGYIAYIDEAGDPGLNKVRPIDENGSSEWLVVSAVVIKASREDAVVDWVRDIRTGIGITQRNDLHFRSLSPTRKVAVASALTSLPLRGFAVLSNKKNMRGYHNPRAARVPSQQWYYNYCIRLLLERVTAFCAERTMKDHGEVRPIKIEFSQRGGHSYGQTKAYHAYMRLQQQGKGLYLQKREPVREMMNLDLMVDIPHRFRAGLQLADTVASAFYQSVDSLGPGTWSTAAAEALLPIMARERGIVRDFGVALFPTPAWKAELTQEQQVIFRACGYDFTRW
jgi:hypothetical protein